MNILDGKMVSKKIHEEVKKEVSILSKKPCLLVILVGDDQASQIYVASKEKACKKVGMLSKTIVLDKNSSQKQVIDIIQEANKDNNINGILVQMPLPDHMNAKAVVDAISPLKDVDGLHAINQGKLMLKEERIDLSKLFFANSIRKDALAFAEKNIHIEGVEEIKNELTNN